MKKIVLSVACVLMSVCLIACGAVQMDIKTVTDEVMPEIGFDEQLFEIETSRAEEMYDISHDSVKNCIAYVSSAAVVDEYSIWEATNSTAAAEISEKLTQRVDAQREVYSTYNQSQLKKLDNAVILHKDSYVVLCISNNADTAKKLLTEYFG